MTNRMLRAAWITLLLCLSESEKARYRKMSNDRNATRTPNDWDTTRTQNDWDATRTQNDWDATETQNDWDATRTQNDWNAKRTQNGREAARTLSYEDVPNTLYESPAAPFQREKGPDRIQTGSPKKRSIIPFIVAGGVVLVVIAALVFFLGSSGSKNSNSHQAGSAGSTGSAKSSGSSFSEIDIVCPDSSMHVGETMPIAVKAGDKVYFAASPNITWSVDNSSVAYVSTEGDGALVGVSEGKVTITAEINGITDSEVIEVIAAE